MEYGLVETENGPKIYGAGLLSSVGESQACLSSHVKKIPLSVACVEQSYDITEPQPQLFVARSMDHLSHVLGELEATLAFRVGGEEGLKSARLAENFSIYPGQNYEPCYLAGMLAAKLSKTGTIGTVAGFAVPATNANINAYREGARSINPDVILKVAFIGSWYDPPKAKEATIAQVEQGVDVVLADRAGVIEGAAERNILAFGVMSDQAAIAPETVVTSVIWDPYPLIKESLETVMAGTFKGQDLSPFELMSKGGSYLMPYGAFETKIPDDVKALITAKTEEITSGAFVVKYDGAEPTSD